MEYLDPAVNPEWHEERRKGIFATDVGPILRLSRFGKGPLDVAVDKIIGGTQNRGSASMSMGKRLEPIIAELYQEKTGRTLRRAAGRREDWMGANGDFEAIEERAISGPLPYLLVECKANSDHRGWGEPGTDRVPPDILVQCQWQMHVYHIPACDVAALFHLSDFEIFPIEYNPKLVEMLVNICGEFWEKCQRKEFPEFSWEDPRTRDLVPLIYRPDGRTVIELNEEAQQLADDMEALGESIKTMSDLKKEKQSRLHQIMGEATFGLFPDGQREVRRKQVAVSEHKVAARIDNRLSVCKRDPSRIVTT